MRRTERFDWWLLDHYWLFFVVSVVILIPVSVGLAWLIVWLRQ